MKKCFWIMLFWQKKIKMFSFCTLFNSSYLTRGLAMYESLLLNSGNFHLYIFAFDNESYDILKRLNLEHATIISLLDFEDEELLEVKKSRSPVEYCWTCTPSIIKYSIKTYNLDMCTYLDADIYFFENPDILITEMYDASVLITKHRYTDEYEQIEKSGIYCVQFMPFRNDIQGMETLNWWRKSCNNWCFSYFEDGKFGDQKYLDDWPERFKGVHVSNNLGGGVAPWNVQQYNFSIELPGVKGVEVLTKKTFPVIFYHFHALKFLKGGGIDLGTYKLSKESLSLLYKPYIMHISRIENYLESLENYNYREVSADQTFWLKKIARILKRKIKGVYNVFEKSKFFT
jgi:hypothetical protein